MCIVAVNWLSDLSMLNQSLHHSPIVFSIGFVLLV